MSNIAALFLVSFLFAGCANPYPGYWNEDDKKPEPKPTPPIINSTTGLERADILALMRQETAHTVTQEELKAQVLSFIASDPTAWIDADIDNAITGVQQFTKTYQPGFIAAPAGASDITFTVFTLENTALDSTGFALTCNDIRIGTVLAAVEAGPYSIAGPQSSFFVNMFLLELDAYIKQIIALYNAFTEADIQLAAEKYERLRQGDYDEPPLPNALVSTRWGRGYPYNRAFVSITNYAGNFQMGSDAVSLAQIMAYHQKPPAPLAGVLFGGPQPIEFFRDRYSSDPNTRVFFEDMAFEWSGMKSAPVADSLLLAYQQQISVLMFQIAALAGKEWDGSSTAVPDIYHAQKAIAALGYNAAIVVPYNTGVYFSGPDNSVYKEVNQYYTHIKPDLQDGLPLYAGAVNEAAGGKNAGWVIDNCQVKTAGAPVQYPVEYVHCIPGEAYSGVGWYMNSVFGSAGFDLQPNSPYYEMNIIRNIY